MSYSRSGSSIRDGNPNLMNPNKRNSNKPSADLLGEETIPDYVVGYSRQPNMNIAHNLPTTQYTQYDDRESNPNVDGGSLAGWRKFKHGLGKVAKVVEKVAPTIATIAPLVL